MEHSLAWKADSSWASQKYPEFYKTWTFITVFTTDHHLSQSWVISVQSKSSHLIYSTPFQYYASIYSCLPSGLFPSGFPIKTLYVPLLFPPLPSPYRSHAPPIPFFLIWPVLGQFGTKAAGNNCAEFADLCWTSWQTTLLVFTRQQRT